MLFCISSRRASEIAENERVQKGVEIAKDELKQYHRQRKTITSCQIVTADLCLEAPHTLPMQDTGKVVMEKTQQGLEAVKALRSWRVTNTTVTKPKLRNT